jgi:DNA repair protein SbcD/Mre11
VRILHLADLHLGWQPRFLNELCSERARERDAFLKRAIDFALDKNNRIAVVVIAGDLFETHRPEQAVLEMSLEQLNRLEKAGIFLITVPGNHDEISYRDSVYRREGSRWPGILVQNPQADQVACLENNGEKTAFYSLAYTSGITRTAQLDFPRSEANRHIGIFHGSLDWDAGDRSLPLSGKSLAASGYSCVLLGHIHQHSVRTLGRVQAVYAGAAEAKSYDDPGTGFLTVVNLGEKVSVDTYDALCRPCFTHVLDISNCEGPDELGYLLEEIGNPQALAKVVLSGVAPFQPDTKVLLEQYKHRFYHLEIDSDGLFLSRSLIQAMATEPTIRGYFVRKMQERLEASADEQEIIVLNRALMRGVAALGGGV